jgi:hypothetical protein
VGALRECQDRLARGEPAGSPDEDMVRDRLARMVEFLGTVESLADRFVGSDKKLAMLFRLLVGRG